MNTPPHAVAVGCDTSYDLSKPTYASSWVGFCIPFPNRGVEMPTSELGRRLASASDRLRAARRDGNFADIQNRLDEIDALLEEFTAQLLEEVWAQA